MLSNHVELNGHFHWACQLTLHFGIAVFEVLVTWLWTYMK